MNLVGKIIGNRYEILEEIGNGGMATVYKAKCHVLNRFVAVKVLKEEFTTDAEFVRRFNTEAQSAASLSHPNIVSIYDVGSEEDGNIHYIVMELVKGKTLKEIIKEERILSWKWTLNIAIQIASALEVAHKNGIIHRDIKPHNIIITEDGIAKVTDFGIAKAVSNSTITAFGTTIGSVHYFSPEQAKGGFTDAKSDLYSLGVVMYEMLTGKVPFDADTPVSVALKHMQEEAPAPNRLNPDIPYAVNQIVLKAMQKDPIRRYQTATEMLQDLSRALKNPNGDFVIIEDTEYGYTRVMKAVTSDMIDDEKGSNKQKEEKKKETYFKKHPAVKVFSIILAFVVLFIVVLSISRLVANGGTSKEYDLPNLVGITRQSAEEFVKDKKIKLEIKEEYSEDVEQGKIISQDPEYKQGEKIKSKDTIKVVISKGKEEKELTKLVGMKFEDAQKEAERLGINLNREDQADEKIEKDVVISQDPKEKAKVKSGDTVTVYVSTGPAIKTVNVPSVINMTEETAKATLTSAGLEVSVAYASDKSQSNGKVIAQTISEGKTVDEGTAITITVNKYEEETSKTVKIHIDVKSLTGGYSASDNTISDKDKKVNVSVTVDGSQKFSQDYDKNRDDVVCEITGKGTAEVIVKAGSATRTKTVNFNENTNLYFE